MTSLLVNLAINWAIAFAAWAHYRNRSYPATDKFDTFWPRFFAGVIDSAVFLPLSILVYMTGKSSAVTSTHLLADFIDSILWFTYSMALHAYSGQTIGKRLCRIRVVRNADEGPIGWREATLRDIVPFAVCIATVTATPWLPMISREWAFTLLAAIPTGWALLEILTTLTNDRRRAVHDYLAGTVVIRTTCGDERPNKSLQPTATAVMPPAVAGDHASRSRG